MKTITLGLALSLLGGVAMAQTPPPPPASSPPALKQPAAGPIPAPPAAQQNAQAMPPAPQAPGTGQPPIPAPSGPPEGMVVETPNGFYLVRPGDPNPQRLDVGRDGGMAQGGMGPGGMGQPGMGRHGMDRPMMGQNGPAAMAEGDDTMDGMAEDGMKPPRPRGRPPHPPEGKGARLHIHAPNLDVNVKCPDDEPIKACVDAISQLMDKANTAPH